MKKICGHFNKFLTNKFLTLLMATALLLVVGCRITSISRDSEQIHLREDLSAQTLTKQQIDKIAERVSAYVVGKLSAANELLKKSPRPDCKNQGLIDYLNALLADGQSGECLRLAESCLSQDSSGHVALVAAQCADDQNQFSKAFNHYSEATDKKHAAVPGFKYRVYKFATFAESQSYVGQADKILGGVYSEDKEKYLNLRQLLRATVSGVSKVDRNFNLNKVAEIEFADKDPYYRALIAYDFAWLMSYSEYRARDSLIFLSQIIDNKLLDFLPPVAAYSVQALAFENIYFQGYQSFPAARSLYQKFVPYARRNFSGLPTESNTYTYADITAKICKDSILLPTTVSTPPSELARRFKALRENIRQGKTPIAAALTEAQAIGSAAGSKADVLTLIGNLNSFSGEDQKAMDHYWQAHQQCSFYNRAHYGLVNSRAKIRQSQLENAGQLKAEFAAKAQGKTVPANLSSYILNYAALTPNMQQLLLPSLEFLFPYMDFLYSSGYRMYIKSVFESLSEAPTLQQFKDQYSASTFRLYDDIRGLASQKVIVADNEEIFQIPFSLGSNVPVHEAAHQFHFSLPLPLQQCLKGLYDAAKARKVFSSGYAAQNQYEYFAMAVNEYLVPVNSPSYMGVNQSWYYENDPRLHSFIKSIESARGDINGIRCPNGSESVPKPVPSEDIFIATVPEGGGNEHRIYIASDPDVSEVQLCYGDSASCRNQPAGNVEFQLRSFSNGRNYYRSISLLKPVTGKTVVTALGFSGKRKLAAMRSAIVTPSE